MAKRRKGLSFHPWLNNLAIEDVLLGRIKLVSIVFPLLWRKWAEQNGGGQGAQISGLPGLSYIATP